SEPSGEFLEVELRFVLLVRELHGVAAAQRRRARTHLAVEEFEVTMLAALAVTLLVRPVDLQLVNRVPPQVDVEHRRRDTVQVAGEDFKRLGDFKVCNHGNDGSDYACRLASRVETGRRSFLENAA